jgi:hypothetical protein
MQVNRARLVLSQSCLGFRSEVRRRLSICKLLKILGENFPLQAQVYPHLEQNSTARKECRAGQRSQATRHGRAGTATAPEQSRSNCRTEINLHEERGSFSTSMGCWDIKDSGPWINWHCLHERDECVLLPALVPVVGAVHPPLDQM